LLVLLDHVADPAWQPLNGYLGVVLFFGISGYIITTLLLREEHAYGRVDIASFYIRRAFRLFPLFYLALAAYTVAVLGLNLGQGGDDYAQRLPQLALYLNEFAGSGTFSHSWSLGVEEKFYVVWPLLAFALLPLIRHRAPILLGLLVIALTSYVFDRSAYPAIYTPIILGAGVALLLHNARTFDVVRHLAAPGPAAIALVVVLVLLVTDPGASGYVHVPFALGSVLVFPAVVLAPWLQGSLGSRIMVWIGRRSYAVYLFHPLVKEVIDKGVAPGSDSLPREIVRIALLIAISLAVAEILARVVENPMRRYGHRLAGRRKPTVAVPAL
jgi:peptidoglycan/LPS O-acetylase OafA/YrhL